MHDHTLISINVDWSSATAVMQFKNEYSIIYERIFNNIISITIPRNCPWGYSSGVNNFSSVVNDKSLVISTIEMQSGDIIEIVAKPGS